MDNNDYDILEKGIVNAHKANPEVYSEIVNYLGKHGKIPEFARDYLGNANAAFQTDPWDLNVKQPGKIIFNRNRFDESPEAATVIHELTHAADRQLGNHYAAFKAQGIKNQFTDAYEKLMIAPRKGLFDSSEQKGTGVEEIIKRIAPKWGKENSDYRTKPNEALAFAVGNTSAKAEDTWDAPPHVNATIATNFRILMDLANRFPMPKPKETKKKAGGKVSLSEVYNKGGKVSLI